MITGRYSLFPYHRQHRQGLTLVELLITIAISAIIIAITFTGLRTEQQRTAAKDATDRLQTELVGLQNKMQSGVVLASTYCTRGGGNFAFQGKNCAVDANCLVAAGNPGSGQGRCISGPPSGFGISIAPAGTTYTLFADMPLGTVLADGKYVADNIATPAIESNDVLLQPEPGKSLGQGIQVAVLKANGATSTAGIDISFSGVNGQVIITDRTSASCGATCTTARIILKHTVTGVCYAITIDSASQIVGKRQFSPNCQ